MFAMDDIRRRASTLVIATGTAILAALLIQSLDSPLQRYTTDLPDDGSVGEDSKGNRGGISAPPPVPPFLQKGFLR